MPCLKICLTLICLLAAAPQAALAADQRMRGIARLGDFSLSLARAGDRVWLFELSSRPPRVDQPMILSPMIDPAVRGRLTVPDSPDGQVWSGPGITVTINRNPPLLTVSQADGAPIFALEPYTPDGRLAGLLFSGPFTHLTGLGADFRIQSNVLNLLGQVILPGGPFGNARLAGRTYHPNQVQAPIVYGLGPGRECGALLIDETLPLQWNFKTSPWTVTAAGPLAPHGSLRFAVITGPDLASLRSEFMNLVGRPPVPPQKIMGVWVSGLKAVWPAGPPAPPPAPAGGTAGDAAPAAASQPEGPALAEFKAKLAALKAAIPNFSGLAAGLPEEGGTGLPALLKAEGLGLILDEAARIPMSSEHYQEMARRSFLVKKGGRGGPPLAMNYRGRESGLIDYTNSAAAAFWHSLGREKLAAEGQTFFRLLDGDLEEVGAEAWYNGDDPSAAAPHSHYVWSNAYALKWLEGLESRLSRRIFGSAPRPVLMTRTGTAGLARYSGYLYNGETVIFTGGFAGQSVFGARSHLAMAGVDYYSSDLTSALAAWPMERFFQSYDAWLAKSALTHFPLILPEELISRPASQYNLALRESLSPYIYSLSWRAWLEGRPVLAPLVYYFQDDLKARDRLPEIMLGPELLVSLDLDGSAERTGVYVPRGRWYDWRTGEVIDQAEGGEMTLDTKVNGQITPPVLARGGAIIPTVEYLSPKEGVREKIAALKIFIDRTPSEMTWYEDDGQSLRYRQGDQRLYGRTLISAVTQADGSTVVTIKAREGNWAEAPAERALLIDIYGPEAPGQATLDDLPHNRVAQASALDRMESGWASFGNNRIRFRTPPLNLSVDHVLRFK